MSIVRYKNKPITPVDAVLWDGTNFEEIKTLCPEVTVPYPDSAPSMLWIPSASIDVLAGEYVMKNVAGGTYSKLAGDVFVGLYTLQ